jgi:hypothetical protein
MPRRLTMRTVNGAPIDMPLERMMALAAAVVAAVAIWLSRGVLGIVDGGEGPSRIGFLPPLSELARLIAAAAAAVFVFGLRLRTVAPLFGGVVLVAPWIPGLPPDPLIVWAEGLLPLAWLAIGIGVMATVLPIAKHRVAASSLGDPNRAPWIAGGLIFVLALTAARHVSPRIPGGDEPHYLVMAQSLLTHGHLRIEATHRDGAYREYYAADLAPHFLRRGQDGEIYSIHAPGLPVLLLPSFGSAGYLGARVFIALVAAIGAGLAWRAGFHVTGSAAAAWFGYASVTLSAPFFLHTFTIYPDIVAAVIVLVALWPLLAPAGAGMMRWVGHGALLACLPWLHTRYAVLAGVLALLTAVHLRGSADAGRRLLAFLAVPTISAGGWLAFFYVIYGTVDPRAPYGTVPPTGLAHVPAGVAGLAVDQQFGLVANSPVLLIAVVGLIVLWRRRLRLAPKAVSWLALALLVVALPYGLAVASYPMWWGGWSAPGRFLVPVLLPLAVASAAAWRWPPAPAFRHVGLALLVVSTFITGVLTVVEQGALLYDVRGPRALWIDWVSAADLAMASPSVFRDGAGGAAVQGAVWLAWLAVAWIAIALVGRWTRPGRGVTTAATIAIGAVAITGALATAPLMVAEVPSRGELTSLRLMRRVDTGAHPIGVRFRPLQLARTNDLVPHLVAVRAPDNRTSPPRDNNPIAHFPRVPAGRYRIAVEASEPFADAIAVVIGREAGPPLHVLNSDRQSRRQVEGTVEFPVDVHSIALHGEDSANRGRRVILQPLALTPRRQRAAALPALREQVYGGGRTYFLDDAVYPERAGFWVKGGRRASVVIDSGDGGARLFVRNGPMAQTAVFRTPSSSSTLMLGAGEEQFVDLPRSGPHPSALHIEIECPAAFRPADVDPASFDQRWLGCWVESTG